MAEYNYPGYGRTSDNWLSSRPDTKSRSAEVSGGSMMVKAVSTYRTKFNAVRNHARLNSAVAIFSLLSLLLMNCRVCASEPPTREVLQLCRSQLSTERETLPIDLGSKREMPPDYRQASRAALGHQTMLGWLAHKNPNGTSTVVIRTIDRETKERSFLVLFQDGKVTLKVYVTAFEFAFSKRDHDGVTGLFFCSKTGPSPEWVWDGKDWEVAK